MLNRLSKLLILMIPVVLLAQCGGVALMKDSNVTVMTPPGNNVIDKINSSSLSIFIFNNLEWILPVVILCVVLAIFFNHEIKKKKNINFISK